MLGILTFSGILLICLNQTNQITMTKKLLLIPSLLFTFMAGAQEMNWKDGAIEPNSKKGAMVVPYGEFTNFKINDINLFLYSVVIEGKRIELETPVPTELQTLFRLPSDELQEAGEAPEVKEAVADASAKAQKVTSAKPAIVSNLSNNIAKQNGLMKANGASDDASVKSVENFEDASKAFVSASDKVSNDIEVIKQARVKMVMLAQQDFSHAQMVTNLPVLPKNPSDHYKTMTDAYGEVQDAYTAIETMAGSGNVPQEIQDAMNKITSTLKVIQDEKLSSVYGETEFLYLGLSNKKNFTAIAPPVQGDGDFVNYSVTVTPSRTNSLGPYLNPQTFDFDIPVKGGWKADFSVGPTFSFGDGAKDEKYYFENTGTDGEATLKQRDNGNVVSPGLAAMMHFYRRSGKDFSWGGMMGVGAGFQAVDDADVSFYTGLSAVLGKSQKIMLSAGVSFLKVDRLKEGEYAVDTVYNTANVTLGDVTEKVIKSSFFLSISYSLTNRIEK